jgi:hypothetical protein
MRFKIVVVGLIMVLGFSGCDKILNAGLVLTEPKASGKYTVEPHNIAREQICIKETLNDISKTNPHWDTNITKIYTGNRGLETGEFEAVNRVGIRIQVSFRDENNVYINVKASGLYFKDLGADEALDNFSNILIKCINKKDK